MVAERDTEGGLVAQLPLPENTDQDQDQDLVITTIYLITRNGAFHARHTRHTHRTHRLVYFLLKDREKLAKALVK